MAYPGRVRIVGPEEEEEVMALCRDLHQENGMFTMNEKKVRAMLARAFNRDGGILGAIGAPGHIEALVFLMVSSFWYSDEPHLEEIFTYVAPQHRKSRAAIELLQFAKWCVDESGMPLVIGVLSNERTEGKVRLYQRQFSKPVGNFFFYSKHGTVPDLASA